MKWAASEDWTTSTAWMLLESSWLIRWKRRSAPERSTRGAMPGYFTSNALAIFSATGRSTEVYQTTLPSFFAASINAGVMALAGGDAPQTGEVNAVAASAAEPVRTSRRDNRVLFIVPSSCAARARRVAAGAIRSGD